jgi:hypothetical protein
VKNSTTSLPYFFSQVFWVQANLAHGGPNPIQ